jgi:hypothetical protein
MKKWIVLGLLCISIPTGATDRYCVPGYSDPLAMICNRVDPGNTKEANGGVKAFDCLTWCPDTIPQVSCNQCTWARPDWAPTCTGCVTFNGTRNALESFGEIRIKCSL